MFFFFPFFFTSLHKSSYNHRPVYSRSFASRCPDIIRLKRVDRLINDLFVNESIDRRTRYWTRSDVIYIYIYILFGSADRCVEEWIRDRWVCCWFGSGARSCVKMKGETRATWPDEKTRKTNGRGTSWSRREREKDDFGCHHENRKESVVKLVARYLSFSNFFF